MNSVKFGDQNYIPSKIVCIGRNYVEHIKELGSEMPKEPVFFFKPNSSIAERLNSQSDSPIHYEAELAFIIIGGELSGVGFGLDLTKREVQDSLKDVGLPWERSKAFDGAAVFSEFIRFEGDVDTLELELFINGSLIQKGGCQIMINKPKDILAEAKTFTSFEDGDVLMTGTPKGVGVVNKGDSFKGKIFQNGSLILEAEWLAE